MATPDCITYGPTSEVTWRVSLRQGLGYYAGKPSWFELLLPPQAGKVPWPSVELSHEKFPFGPGHSKRLFTAMKYTEAFREIQLFAGLFSEAIEESFVATATELAEILTDVNGLAFQVEADEYGLVRPSYHAFKHCLRLVLMLAQRGALVKPSSISTDPNGAIRITWASDDREAEVVCPSEEAELPYVYHSSSDKYGIESDLSPEALTCRIRWAIGGK